MGALVVMAAGVAFWRHSLAAKVDLPQTMEDRDTIFRGRVPRVAVYSPTQTPPAAPSVPRAPASTTEAPANFKDQNPGEGVAGAVRGIDFAALTDEQKERTVEAYKKQFVREFDPFARFSSKLDGRASIALRQTEAHFNVRFDLPLRPTTGENGITVYLIGIDDPTAHLTSTALLEDLSSRGDEVVFHFSGAALAPFFSGQIGLDEVTDVMFGVDLSKASGRSEVLVRRSFSVAEKPDAVGSFEYRRLD